MAVSSVSGGGNTQQVTQNQAPQDPQPVSQQSEAQPNDVAGAYQKDTFEPAPASAKTGGGALQDPGEVSGGAGGEVKAPNATTQALTPSEAQADGQLIDGKGNIVDPSTPLNQVEGTVPKGGTRNNETVLYVNGIRTDVPGQEKTMQNMANSTGSKVIGLHNSTEGTAKDILQTGGDKIDVGPNKAADNMTNVLYSELKAGRDVHVMAHSQGAAITARALRGLEQRLLAENGGDRAKTQGQLSHLKVDTFGGAGRRFPDGPKYDHYVNRLDPVPMTLGQNNPLAGPGAGAKVHYFTDGTIDPRKVFDVNHNIDTMYLKHYPM